jgi:hypothetical protein
MEEATGAPSSLAVWDPKRLRASNRDGGVVVNQPPSPLTMLFSRHTKRLDNGGAVLKLVEIEATRPMKQVVPRLRRQSARYPLGTGELYFQ